MQGLQGLESGFGERIMCMGVSRRPPSAAWPQLSGWRRYRRRSGVAVATGVVALLHVVAGAPFVRCHLFEPRPRPYCRESIGLQRQVLDTTAHCHAPGPAASRTEAAETPLLPLQHRWGGGAKRGAHLPATTLAPPRLCPAAFCWSAASCLLPTPRTCSTAEEEVDRICKHERNYYFVLHVKKDTPKVRWCANVCKCQAAPERTLVPDCSRTNPNARLLRTKPATVHFAA